MSSRTPAQKECERQGSWIPATPLRPILPKPTNRQANQPDQPNWQGSDCFSSVCNQGSQSNKAVLYFNSADCDGTNRCVNNSEVSSATKMGNTFDNVEASREFSIDPFAKYKNVSFGSLLALANAALQRNDDDPADEVSISHQHSYDIRSHPGTIPNRASPITPEKAMGVKSKQVSELENPCSDDRTNQEREEQDNDIAAERVDSNGIQHNKQLIEPVTDASVSADSTQIKENHTPEKGIVDLNETPPPKPRRKKHRPKVAKEGKPQTPKNSKDNPTVKRKYVRKKGLNNNGSTSAPAEAAEESINLKTHEPAMESCRKTLSCGTGLAGDENSACKSTFDSVSVPQAKDFSQSKSTGQLCEGTEVTTPKPVTPQPNHSKENQMEKRKYVRKKGLNKDSTSTPAEAFGISDDLKKLKPTKKSCRRTLNFDIEGQPRGKNSTSKSTDDLDSESQGKCSFRRGIQSKSIVQLGEGVEVIVENTQAGIAYDLNCSVNQLIKDYISSPEVHKQTAEARKENITEGIGQGTADIGEGNAKQVILQIDSQSSSTSPIDSKCGTWAMIEQREACGPKRKYSDAIKQADTSISNLAGVHFLNLQAFQMPEPHFPNIYQKMRTEKGQNSATSSSSSCVTVAKNISLETTCSQGDLREDSSTSDQEKHKTLDVVLSLSPVERLKKKRSRGLTRVRDFASLIRIGECIYPGSQGPEDSDKQQVGHSQRPQTCIEALVAEMHETLTRKKRTKRNTLVSSTYSNINEAQKHQKIILNNHHQFSSNSFGTLPELTCKQMSSVDKTIEQLNHLDINKESKSIEYQEQNALVLYTRYGPLVPFHGSFDIVKKRRPRPKVELDEETNRVWKLLMQDINSEGINGTDEENARRWEEERGVFHGRVNSFIARMHLVQGDRRFSMWKGSVVDSVVGVFLTQNVSDHLSSSAFMSLAANFPLDSNQKPHHGEETSSVIEEPVAYVLDPEDTIEWNGKMSYQPACDQGSMTLHVTEHNEDREVGRSNDSSESSTGAVSSINMSKCKLMNSCENVPETNNDVLSSQNSMDSSIAQVANGTRSSSNSNSDAGDLSNGTTLNNFNSSHSFVELLQMVGSTMQQGNYNHENGNVLSDENSEHNQFQATCIPPSGFHPCLNQDLSVEIESHEMLGEETRSSGISEKNDNDVTNQIAFTPEFASQTTDATKLAVSGPEAPRYGNKQSSNSMQANKNVLAQHESEIFGDCRFAMESLAHVPNNEIQQDLNLPKLSGGTLDALESSNPFYNHHPKKSVSDWNKYDNSFSKELNDINDATSKPKGRRVGKEKQDDFDWDSLRRHVETNGRKKRPEHTKDSLDWEAVRCADVNKIANTIKERGMNNRLAERIKDFLNRLVRDHGSIDLEWLRDVPPDSAKEFLLSFWGLGLKSVECVRLLTLHHLAFPVDTNVGRIAVRLGWVPLQPLPESLQLHLLELYPVLESIQKYLWPRLCKLDQRTLYELHYQMITFGKVFCTKSKPNCNACPMRGECRHFASAFASSRLALPGPEEKAIVCAKENRTEQNPAMMINHLPLPLPQATEQSVGKVEIAVNNCEPIIEEPATPEPECMQISENDIEDAFCEEAEEIPIIRLNMKEFTQTLQNYMQENLELQEGDMSKALVALTAGAASIPTPKLKNVSHLRTEHQVYELPDSHPLLTGLEKREPDDPGRYLLAIWTPGETENSIQPPESWCSSQEHGKLCDEKTCFSCNNVRESEFQIVRGTILIPCRTAMRGSFPLNGTYFQVNEVFADHDSSLKPINVPREWIWNLPRRTVYFGTSIPSIFKGFTTEGIQHCFWRGYVCVRGFDQKTRAPRPLMARLHFPASKLNKTPGKADADHK